MKKLANIEVFNIEITDEGTFAHISFQDLNNTENLNDGYDNICVPMNLRPIQLSVRGNVLVDQSAKVCQDAVGAVSRSSIIENQLCPKCKEKGSLKYKSYLMFSRVCENDGTYVKLPTHPDYGK